MNQVVIENPIINSPFDEPDRHFRFTDEGITNVIVDGRRTSSYFVPIAKPKKKGKQLQFDTEWTQDRIEENKLVNDIRRRVALWRKGGYVGVTPTTARLIAYWTDPAREKKFFFCQNEALETAIYLSEVAKKYGDAWIENAIRQANDTSNPGLPRTAFKMATGSGKTVVMAMLIAWHTLNKRANPQDARFSDTFLIVTPGITIRDRLRVLLPNDPDNYYRQRDIVPAQLTTDPGDLVLDPTCGSGTTAYVAEQWGRRWITCDTSRVAMALARTRLMAAKYPYYLLADSPEGIKKEAEPTGKIPPEYKTEDDIKKGFVYKRVPHVTLKSIANNPDIREGMTRQQIDASIDRNAETETLYDQPYEDNKRMRVCGPFSVESLSPHRVLSTADDNQDGAVTEQEARKQQDFATMILDNLKKAGVQNTRKGERLTFDRLDPYAGAWLQAAGEYTEADGKTRRVAVSIGPEHGTVGPQQVKEAAKEAVQGIGFDMLVVCGFAFDPHVAEEAKRYGKLTVLPAKMNPDLAMGDELLQKTGAGNLFMVFGEPDVAIKKQKNGQIVAEIKGVDVYDPTTGQIRNACTDDIACWFIDSDYNGESFFVRHAYFTGADEPYDKLKRALRADIDEAAWSSLYSTVSRPFDKPESGKIAVKVINHYGDEVLKVFEI